MTFFGDFIAMTLLSCDEYRNKIPFFKKDYYYFDSSSTTLLSEPVITAITEYYTEGIVRPATGLYNGTFRGSSIIDETRKVFAKIWHVPTEQVVFPSNITIAMHFALIMLVKEHPDSIIVYSNDLSHDTLLPIRNYLKSSNIHSLLLDVGLSTEQWLEKIEQLPSDKRLLVILPWYSLGGEFYDKIDFVHKLKTHFQIKLILDGVIGAALAPYDALTKQADIILFDSNIGWGGPIGQGILISNNTLPMVTDGIYGAGTVKQVDQTSIEFLSSVERYETAINPVVIGGIKEAINLLDTSFISQVNHVRSLNQTFRKYLSEIPKVIIPSSIQAYSNTSVTAFYIEQLNSHDIAMFLDEIYKISLRSGSICAHQLTHALTKNKNDNNLLHVSFHYYNNLSDVNYLVEAIKDCLKTFK